MRHGNRAGAAGAEDGDKLPLRPGDRFGDYSVDRVLGRGGMGVVYLAHSPDGSRFAIKIIYPEKMTHDLRVRFAREAEFAMGVRHENLISVYDVGEDPDTGLCYIIMDYIDGGTLTERIRKSGRMPVGEAVALASKVACALEVAHRCGLVHRDVKPDNIMFTSDGVPKLADLGVAKFSSGREDGERSTMVTLTNMVIGTPAYMSPEQLINPHAIDARSDIYSLGIILYEMLSGERPIKGSTAVEMLAKAIKGDPIPDVRNLRPEVPESVAHALAAICAPKPENRPGSALLAADMLNRSMTDAAHADMAGSNATVAAPRRHGVLYRLIKKNFSMFAPVAIALVVGFLAGLFVGIAGRGTPKAIYDNPTLVVATQTLPILKCDKEVRANITLAPDSDPLVMRIVFKTPSGETSAVETYTVMKQSRQAFTVPSGASYACFSVRKMRPDDNAKIIFFAPSASPK